MNLHVLNKRRNDQKLTIKNLRSETNDQKLTIRNWRSETNDQKLSLKHYWTEWFFGFFFKLYLFYNDYETSYTTYINHVCVRMVFVWEETGVPGGTPPVWLGDHMTISHADAGYRTRVAAVRDECVNTSPARQLVWNLQQCEFCQRT